MRRPVTRSCLIALTALATAGALFTGAAPASGARTAAVTKRSWRIGRVGHWEGRVSSWFRDRLLGLLAPVVAASGYARYAAFDVGPLAPGAAAEELSGA